MKFYTSNAGSATERMRIDSSGNLLVGTTDSLPATNNDSNGIAFRADGNAQFSRSGAATARFNRGTSDGEIVSFNKDGTTVGSIGTKLSYPTIGKGVTGVLFNNDFDRMHPWNIGSNTSSDNTMDLGAPTERWAIVYAGTGSINTSDRNEKQDIAELDEAEKRVAVACKSLIRKFRFNDAVAKKGDDARIHFGIIAQDLQDAFTAEGLDASRYAVFCSDTWWEADEVIPAVAAQDAVYETQTDEDGNEVQVLVSEAVEAEPEKTETRKYHTAEEAPEGAAERTRLGVRYSELLAFIIAAI